MQRKTTNKTHSTEKSDGQETKKNVIYALQVSAHSGPSRLFGFEEKLLMCERVVFDHQSLPPIDRCSLQATCRPPPQDGKASPPTPYLKTKNTKWEFEWNQKLYWSVNVCPHVNICMFYICLQECVCLCSGQRLDACYFLLESALWKGQWRQVDSNTSLLSGWACFPLLFR